MNEVNTISICMGSSCFARGNRLNVEIVETFLEEQGLSATVSLIGSHCEQHCPEGPVIKINNTTFQQVDPEVLPDILRESFSAQPETVK